MRCSKRRRRSTEKYAKEEEQKNTSRRGSMKMKKSRRLRMRKGRRSGEEYGEGNGVLLQCLGAAILLYWGCISIMYLAAQQGRRFLIPSPNVSFPKMFIRKQQGQIA